MKKKIDATVTATTLVNGWKISRQSRRLYGGSSLTQYSFRKNELQGMSVMVYNYLNIK